MEGFVYTKLLFDIQVVLKENQIEIQMDISLSLKYFIFNIFVSAKNAGHLPFISAKRQTRWYVLTYVLHSFGGLRLLELEKKYLNREVTFFSILKRMCASKNILIY